MRGATRSHIVAALKESLRRLQLDHVDLYQIHGFDPATPIEETVRALDTMVEHGHVRYVGVSNWAAWQIMKALGISERLGLARFQSLQAYYTIAGRDLERELVPMLQSEGLGLMVWSPLAGGFLSGKYARDQQGEAGSRRTAFDFPPLDKERAYDAIDVMREIAGARGVSVAQIALAWLLHQPAVTSVIIGAKKPEQLADNIGATRRRARRRRAGPARRDQQAAGRVPGLDVQRARARVRRKQIAEARRPVARADPAEGAKAISGGGRGREEQVRGRRAQGLRRHRFVVGNRRRDGEAVREAGLERRRQLLARGGARRGGGERVPRARRRRPRRARRRRRRRRLPPSRRPGRGRFGRADVLVNNAGTTKFVAAKDLDGLDADDFQRIYAVNVIGAFQMVRAFAPLLARQPGAAIVNVSSIASLMGTGSSLAYMASKGALNALTIGLARSLGPAIRVNAIAPGLVETPWMQNGLGADRYAATVQAIAPARRSTR